MGRKIIPPASILGLAINGQPRVNWVGFGNAHPNFGNTNFANAYDIFISGLQDYCGARICIYIKDM